MQFFVDKCNRDLGEKLRRHEADLAGMGTTDRVRTAVKWRLEMLIPVMGQLSLALLQVMLLATSHAQCPVTER